MFTEITQTIQRWKSCIPRETFFWLFQKPEVQILQIQYSQKSSSLSEKIINSFRMWQNIRLRFVSFLFDPRDTHIRGQNNGSRDQRNKKTQMLFYAKSFKLNSLWIRKLFSKLNPGWKNMVAIPRSWRNMVMIMPYWRLGHHDS